MKKSLVKGSLMAVLAMSLMACNTSEEDSTTSSPATDRSYQAAGSRWDISFTDTTFSLERFDDIDDTTSTMTVSGTVSENATNLFKTLTVTSASGTDAPSNGQTALALEMEGSSTFIQPFGESNPLVATVVSTCPSANFVANWVVTRPGLDGGSFQPSNFDDDGAGTATFTLSGDSFLVRAAGIENGELEASIDGTDFNPFGMASCSNGKLPVDFASEQFDMYFTPTGQIVVKFPDAMGSQIISGFPQTASAVNASTVDGTYSVLLYRGGTNLDLSGATVVPAKVTLSSGTGAIRLISDVDTNTEAGSDLFTLGGFTNEDDSNNALAPGQFRLTLSGGGKLSCVTTDGTPRVLACYGFDNSGTGGDVRRPISLLGRIR